MKNEETSFDFYKRVAAEKKASADKLFEMYSLRKIKDGPIGDALWNGHMACNAEARHYLTRMEESRVPA